MQLKSLFIGLFILSLGIVTANADVNHSTHYRIQDINQMSDEVYIETFSPLFNHDVWIIEQSSMKRPFIGFEDMLQKILNIIKATDRATQLQLVSSHPDLACKTMRAKGIASTSQLEQTQSGLNVCTEDEALRLQTFNKQYKEKFGIPFMLAIKGYNKQDIFVEMAERINNDPETEFQIAMQQYYKVRILRLLDLVK